MRSGLAADIRTRRVAKKVNVHPTIGQKRNTKSFGGLVHLERRFIEARATVDQHTLVRCSCGDVHADFSVVVMSDHVGVEELFIDGKPAGCMAARRRQ